MLRTHNATATDRSIVTTANLIQANSSHWDCGRHILRSKTLPMFSGSDFYDLTITTSFTALARATLCMVIWLYKVQFLRFPSNFQWKLPRFITLVCCPRHSQHNTVDPNVFCYGKPCVSHCLVAFK